MGQAGASAPRRPGARLCTGPTSILIPRYLYVVVVIGGVDTVDNRFPRRSDRVFCPPGLWAVAVDNPGRMWTARRCAHPIHRGRPVLPSVVPRNTQVLPRPTHPLSVTPFTRSGDGGRRVAEQWTALWRSCAQPPAACGPAVDNRPRPRWTVTLSTACGRPPPTIPHPPELRRRHSTGAVCGPAWDNADVPILWTAGPRDFCGVRPRRRPGSNTPRPRKQTLPGPRGDWAGAALRS